MESMHWLCVLILGGILIAQCAGRMDCAQKEFDGSSTSAGKVYCSSSFHECGTYGDACCNDVEASPVQLTLVILGPVTFLWSGLLAFFVVKTVVGVFMEGSGQLQSDRMNKD